MAGRKVPRAITDASLHVHRGAPSRRQKLWKISLADAQAGVREENVVEKVHRLFEAETERPSGIANTNAIS